MAALLLLLSTGLTLAKPATSQAGQRPAHSRSWTRAGVVVDLRGIPIDGAEVWATNDPTPAYRASQVPTAPPIARTTTDANGLFRLPALPHEICSIWASAPGRCRNRILSTAQPLEIELHEAATVRGTAHTPGGKAVVGAIVRTTIMGRALRNAHTEATTDASGRFVLEQVPLGLIRIAAVAPGHGVLGRTLLVQDDADIRLVPWTKVTTTVTVTCSGVPAPLRTAVDVGLIVTHGPQLPPPWDHPRLDATGQWSGSELPDVGYTARPTLPGFVFEPDEIKVMGTAGPHTLKFQAAPQPVWPASLRDLDNRPVAGVEIELRSWDGQRRTSAISNAKGELELQSPVANGTRVDILCSSPDWVLEHQSEQGSPTIRHGRRWRTTVDTRQLLLLTVKPANQIEGRLLRPDGGPAALVFVRLEDEVSGRSPRWASIDYTSTGPDGSFRFTGLHTTPDRVRITSRGSSGQFASGPFHLDESGQSIRLGEFQLAAPAIVEGVVRDAKGDLRPGIRVGLRREGSWRETVTDRLGRYRFRGVPAEEHWLYLLARKRYHNGPPNAPFAVVSGATHTFDLVLRGR